MTEPNEETKAALEEPIEGLPVAKTVDELFDELDIQEAIDVLEKGNKAYTLEQVKGIIGL